MNSVFPNQDIQRLIEQARKGHQESLNEICKGLLPVVTRMCHSLFPEHLIAKSGESDLVQESLLGVSQCFATFQGTDEAALVAWVQAIVEHKSMNIKRRFHGTEMRDVARERPLEAEASSRLEMLLAGSSESPLDQLISIEEFQQLHRLLQQLPSHYQEIVQLRHRDAFSFPEIASQLNRTEASVKNIYVRALQQLENGLSKGE